MRAIAIVSTLILLAVRPAHAYWQYAEWGMTPTQVSASSHGKATACRPDISACAGGAGLAIQDTQMLGLPCSVAFFFDGQGHLDRTVVTFRNADFGLVSSLLQGVHGAPVTPPQGSPLTGVWRDERRGSSITLTGAGSAVTMAYQPAKR